MSGSLPLTCTSMYKHLLNPFKTLYHIILTNHYYTSYIPQPTIIPYYTSYNTNWVDWFWLYPPLLALHAFPGAKLAVAHGASVLGWLWTLWTTWQASAHVAGQNRRNTELMLTFNWVQGVWMWSFYSCPELILDGFGVVPIGKTKQHQVLRARAGKELCTSWRCELQWGIKGHPYFANHLKR